jgi:hypothetical protein
LPGVGGACFNLHMRIAWLGTALVAASLTAGTLARAEDPKPGAPAAKAATAPQPRRAARAKGKKDKESLGVAQFPGFQMLPDGSSRVFVDISRKVDVTEHVAAGFVTYELKDSRIEATNDLNPIETYYFNTPVIRARLRRDKKDKDLSLVISLRGEAKPTYRVNEMRDGSVRLEVDFPPGNYVTAGRDIEPPPADRGPSKDQKDDKKKGRMRPKAKAAPVGPPAP